MQKTICACLEIPSTGNRPAGMVAKNTLHSMEGLFLESHKSIDCHRPGYNRGISVCSGPCPSGDTTDAMSAGRPCLTFFELLVTRSSHLIFPAKSCSTFQVCSAHFMEEIGQPGRYHQRLHLENLQTDESNHVVLAGLMEGN